MREQPGASYYPALTGVRAAAAYLVYFHHFNPFPAWSIPWQLANEGHIGVTIFFVLSGFLIPTRCFDRVAWSAGWVKAYFTRRLARIYPLYFIVTVVTFLAAALDASLDAAGTWAGYSPADKVVVMLANLTFVRGYFAGLLSTGVMQGWTLTVEETFYGVAPLLLLALAAVSGRKAQLLILLAVGLLGLGVGAGLVYGAPKGQWGFFGSTQFMLYHTFFGRIFEFLAGVVLAVSVRQNAAPRAGAWHTWLGSGWVGMCVAGLGLLSNEREFSWTSYYGIALNNLLLPIGIVALLHGLLTERTRLAAWLSAPLAQRLGRASYAFYLVHMGVFSVLVQRYLSPHTGVHLLALTALALLLHRYVEEPLRRRLVGGPPPG